MHIRTYLSIFLIGSVFAIAGCSSGSSSSGLDRDPIEDIDGDGIADIVDPDIDGDGIPNAQDPDDDNDGVEDSVDPTPPVKPGTKTCVAASILPPNEEATPGEKAELSWTFLPEGCVLPATRANAGTGVKVRAVPQRASLAGGTPPSATVNAGNCVAKGRHGNVQCFTEIEVPDGCGKFGVVYDISEVGIVLGDTNLSKGAYQQTVWHTGESCSSEGLPNPCTTAINLNVNSKNVTGHSTKISWDFAPSGCELNQEQQESVAVITAFHQDAHPDTKTSNPKWTLNDKNAWIIIPNNSDWCNEDPEGSKTISYDFSGIGYVLGDVDGVNAGKYVLSVSHKHGTGNGNSCEAVEPEIDGDGIPDEATCCKICITSKACGDSCISQSFNCSKPKGCACDGTASDLDGDGIPNDSDIDVDGDGIPNTSDKDIDGDGIPNKDDPDIDGDGEPNGVDPDADGDGTVDAEDDTPGGFE